MTVTVELIPAADGWNIALDTPGVHYECQGVSGRRAVQVVTAEVEAAIDRATAGEQHGGAEVRHIDGDPHNNEPSNLRVETRPKSHGVGSKAEKG